MLICLRICTVTSRNKPDFFGKFLSKKCWLRDFTKLQKLVKRRLAQTWRRHFGSQTLLMKSLIRMFLLEINSHLKYFLWFITGKWMEMEKNRIWRQLCPKEMWYNVMLLVNAYGKRVAEIKQKERLRLLFKKDYNCEKYKYTYSNSRRSLWAQIRCGTLYCHWILKLEDMGWMKMRNEDRALIDHFCIFWIYFQSWNTRKKTIYDRQKKPNTHLMWITDHILLRMEWIRLTY